MWKQGAREMHGLRRNAVPFARPMWIVAGSRKLYRASHGQWNNSYSADANIEASRRELGERSRIVEKADRGQRRRSAQMTVYNL